MNVVDRIIGFFDPVSGLQRRAARKVLNQYEAAEPSRLRKFRRETATQNALVLKSASAVRAQARHLSRNHDIARGALRTMVNNIVGPKGIGIEPQPRRTDGTIHDVFAKELSALWLDWQRRPEVTHRHHFAQVQRMVCRAWVRDGEVFAQRLVGDVAYLDHGTRVPYSLELFESEMVPMDYSDGQRISQGIERNAWGRPVRYFVFRQSPSELYRIPTLSDLKPVAFDSMYHVAMLDHVGQLRGVSEFASVITRLEDIKDYEESERVAAKIAAMLTAYVKKGTPDLYQPNDGDKPNAPRSISLAPGMIIDDLAIGEEIGLIDSKRPNPNVLTFRQGQLRAVAAGLGGSYSSISRDYGGTYSSQRQELVEQWIHYATLADEFVGMFLQPVWEDFVSAAIMSGAIKLPRDVVKGSETAATYVAHAMPWIDPLKEALGSEALVKAGFASEFEMIRRRGASPRDVLEQIEAFRNLAKAKGLSFSTMVEPQVAPARPSEQDVDAEEEPTRGAQQDAGARALRTPVAAGEDRIDTLIDELKKMLAREPAASVVIHNAPPATNVEVHNEMQAPPAPSVEVHNAIPAASAPTIQNVVNVPPPPAPLVEVRNEVTVEPAAVAVTLPTRKTETTIVRDAAGNISQATQIETTVDESDDDKGD